MSATDHTQPKKQKLVSDTPPRRIHIEIPFFGSYDALRCMGLIDRIQTRIWKQFGDEMNQIIAEDAPGNHFYHGVQAELMYDPIVDSHDAYDDDEGRAPQLPDDDILS